MLPSSHGQEAVGVGWGKNPPLRVCGQREDLTEAEEREDQDCVFLIAADDLQLCSPWEWSGFGNTERALSAFDVNPGFCLGKVIFPFWVYILHLVPHTSYIIRLQHLLLHFQSSKYFSRTYMWFLQLTSRQEKIRGLPYSVWCMAGPTASDISVIH